MYKITHIDGVFAPVVTGYNVTAVAYNGQDATVTVNGKTHTVFTSKHENEMEGCKEAATYAHNLAVNLYGTEVLFVTPLHPYP